MLHAGMAIIGRRRLMSVMSIMPRHVLIRLPRAMNLLNRCPPLRAILSSPAILVTRRVLDKVSLRFQDGRPRADLQLLSLRSLGGNLHHPLLGSPLEILFLESVSFAALSLKTLSLRLLSFPFSFPFSISISFLFSFLFSLLFSLLFSFLFSFSLLALLFRSFPRESLLFRQLTLTLPGQTSRLLHLTLCPFPFLALAVSLPIIRLRHLNVVVGQGFTRCGMAALSIPFAVPTFGKHGASDNDAFLEGSLILGAGDAALALYDTSGLDHARKPANTFALVARIYGLELFRVETTPSADLYLTLDRQLDDIAHVGIPFFDALHRADKLVIHVDNVD